MSNSHEEIKKRLNTYEMEINSGLSFDELHFRTRDAQWLIQQLREALEREQIAVEALEFYAQAKDANSEVIEAVINGGEYVMLGTMAKHTLSKIRGESK